MTGQNAIQLVVVLFLVLFVILVSVMVLGSRKRKQEEAQSLQIKESKGESNIGDNNLFEKSDNSKSEKFKAEKVTLPTSKKSAESLSKEPTFKETNINAKSNSESSSITSNSNETYPIENKPVETKSRETKSKEINLVESIGNIEKLNEFSLDESASPVIDEITADETAQKNLEKALKETKNRFWGRIQSLWHGSHIADIDEIEEILYTSDLGPQTVERLLTSIKQSLSRSERKESEIVRSALRNELLQIFEKTQGNKEPEQLFEKFQFNKPSIWMVVGVNGAGKTTSIGKIASQLAQNEKKVLVAAGDTFRAAAGSQLQVWTERAQVEIFSPQGVTDPSAVAFDAVQKGVAKGFDVIIVDTAGRLHTQHNLMEEIKKMKRVVQKVLPEAPHEVLLVLDSNQGQNALLQAKEFHKALGVTGVVLTKLDGTAKGGVAVGVAYELELPIKLIGVGEKMEDLRPFSSKSFVESIL